jgi:hypothetical protein
VPSPRPPAPSGMAPAPMPATAMPTAMAAMPARGLDGRRTGGRYLLSRRLLGHSCRGGDNSQRSSPGCQHRNDVFRSEYHGVTPFFTAAAAIARFLNCVFFQHSLHPQPVSSQLSRTSSSGYLQCAVTANLSCACGDHRRSAKRTSALILTAQ